MSAKLKQMPHVNKTKTVSYNPEQMFNLVNDIDAYASFLPWCANSKATERNDDTVKGTIDISIAGVNKSFTTKNTLKQGQSIEMNLVDGPFKHLHGIWQFTHADNGGTKVSFNLDYEFSNKLLAMMIGPLFHQIASAMLDAFCDQARKIYGDG